MTNEERFRPVIITWEDAMTQHGAINSRQYVKTYRPSIRQSIGFLIGKTNSQVHISSTDDRLSMDHEDSDEITSIPMGMVRSISFLSPVQIP